MSDLVVLGFEDAATAGQAHDKIRGLQKENLIELEDACVATRGVDGKIRLKQSLNLRAFGAASGMSTGILMGTLAGVLTLNPLAGMAVGGLVGAGFGAISGSLADYGINDEFIQTLANTLSNNSSALFVLVKRSTADKVIPEVQLFNPRVLKTSLSNEQEEKLKAAFVAWKVMHQAKRRASQSLGR